MRVATSSVPEEWRRLGVRVTEERTERGWEGWDGVWGGRWRGDSGQDRVLVAGCKVWASRRDRKGERKAGFSEVNQLWGLNPLRKSQRSTPRG